MSGSTPSGSTPISSGQDLQAWLGRTETAFDSVTPQLAQRMAATLESSRPGKFARGDHLPQGWYSVLFPRVVPRSQLGRDGHPALGDFLPPVPLPKRMFAGKRITFVAPICIGDELERVSTIASITPKQGSSGPLVFVTLRHEIRRGTQTLVVEEQDVVYRNEVAAQGKAASAAPKPFGAEHVSADITADPVMIFRYSALSFNGHRIHYDLPYATGVEGYPGLVVNGGLSTLCALEHVHEQWGGQLTALTTRNTAPLFVGDAFHMESKRGEGEHVVEFRVVALAGHTVVAGSATLHGERQ